MGLVVSDAAALGQNDNDGHIQWEAKKQNDGSWHLEQPLQGNIGANEVTDNGVPHKIQIELEIDLGTTYADVYKLHAQSIVNNSLRLDAQVDVDIVLAVSHNVHLLEPGSLGCHGDCSLLPQSSLTIIRRLSSESTGGLTDMNYHPAGEIQIAPVSFSNGSEVHRLDTALCDVLRGNDGNVSGGHGTAIVSQYTGRCLVHAPGAHGALYGDCNDVTEASRCWILTPSKKPHDASKYNEYSMRTLSFDDSGLQPHKTVISPTRSERSLFMQASTVTDIHFNVRLFIDPIADVPSDKVTTPARLYDSQKRVVAVKTCTATHQGMRVSCSTTCNMRATYLGADARLFCVPYGMPSTIYAECSPDCVPSLLPRSSPIAAGIIDIDLVKLTSGYQLRMHKWNDMRESDSLCIASNTVKSDPDIAQAVECTTVFQDYYDVVQSASFRYIRSNAYGKCLGRLVSERPHLLGTPYADSIGMIECNRTNDLIRLVHSFRDDGAMYGGPSADLWRQASRLPEALFRYTDSVRSVTGLVHRQESGGTVRVIVNFGTVSVSLIDDSGLLTRSPNTHQYLVRIKRDVDTNGTETRTLILRRNGTVIDVQGHTRHSARTNSTLEGAARAYRSTTYDTQVLPLGGVVNEIDMISSKVDAVNLVSADNARHRFGSGYRRRLYRHDRMQPNQ